jgi:hypothetical protein
MPLGSIDSVADTTIWGRVRGDDVTGPVRLRVEVDGALWKLARADHVDPDGGRWRFAIHHELGAGSQVGVYALANDHSAAPPGEPLLADFHRLADGLERRRGGDAP